MLLDDIEQGLILPVVSCDLIREISLPAIDKFLPLLHFYLLLLIEDTVHVLLPGADLLQFLLHFLQFTLETLPLGLLQNTDSLQLLLPLFVWRTNRREVFLLRRIFYDWGWLDACLFFLIGVWSSMFGCDKIDVLWDGVEYFLCIGLLLLHDDALGVKSGLSHEGVSVGLRELLATLDVHSFTVRYHFLTCVSIESYTALLVVYIGS